MTNRPEEKPTRTSKPVENAADHERRLPETNIDEEQTEVIDLPRKGPPKDVARVQRGIVRLPELLIDE